MLKEKYCDRCKKLRMFHEKYGCLKCGIIQPCRNCKEDFRSIQGQLTCQNCKDGNKRKHGNVRRMKMTNFRRETY
ncbi:MAG: hypothetical protein DRQ46_00140 [Gammaproteobacteria bacterium]|nr:MAG: hypothetical protein DRQ46_00140 [Gammaproteobacteria bacterium]